jgi:hypothetical protein
MSSIKKSFSAPKSGQQQRVLASIAMMFVLASCVGTSEEKTPISVSDQKPVLMMPDAPTFKSVKPGTSEELLAAEGKWNMIEEGEVYDPAMEHLKARKKVNPKQMKKRDDLVVHFEPEAQSGEDGKFRVLKMEALGNDWQNAEAMAGFEVAETSIAKPTQKVVGTELVAKIRSAFEAEAHEVEREAPVPAAKSVAAVEAVPVPVKVTSVSVQRPPELPARKTQSYSAVQTEPEFVLNTKRAPKPVPSAPPQKSGFLGTLKKSFAKDSNQDAQATQPSAPAAVVQDVAVSPKVKYQIISSGQSSSKTANLTGFRSAIHDGRTRVAMDLSSSIKYKVAIDHIRNVLRVKLEKTKWMEPPRGVMRASDLLGTYVTTPQPDGSTILEIRLKKKAKIADTMILKPDQTAHHRIVIDLQS